MERPVVIVNFKAYPQAIGEKAVALARECERAGEEYGVDMRVAVLATDVFRVAQEVRIPVYAQHADLSDAGARTGWIGAHALQAAGARGALVNHAEHRVGAERAIATARALMHAQLDAVVIAADAAELALLDARLAPTFFCVEPKELIGGDVSVSSAQPELVKRSVLATRSPVLVGAGVKSHEDVLIATELGARGVLLASGIVLAAHRAQAFKKLLSAHAA